MPRRIIAALLTLGLSFGAASAQMLAPDTHSYLEVINLKTHERRVVLDTPQLIEAPNWSRDGKFLIYNSKGHLYQIPVAGGAAVQIDTGTRITNNNDHGLSPDGKWLAISDQTKDGQSRVYVLPSTGGEPREVTPQAPSYWHGWSPDGKRLAFVGQRKGDFNIFSIPIEGGPEKQLTEAKGLDDGPDYGTDGTIYFNSDRTGQMHIYAMNSDGTNERQLTFDKAYGDWFPHPSPDNKTLVFLSFDADVKGHPPGKYVRLRTASIKGLRSGKEKPKVLVELFGGQGTINVPSWSPDSQWIAFVRNADPAVVARNQSLEAITADDPAFVAKTLTLSNIPKATGPLIDLFNGKDLNDWTGWLGYADPAQTYAKTEPAPIGPGGIGSMFKVVMVDGTPALFVDGTTWGSLVHRGDYANYHLSLEYKWGKRHAPRLDQPENNGLLYHSHGKPGAVWGTWMRAMEFEIMTGSTGMVVPVGTGVEARTEVGRDASIIDPKRRYMPGGRDITLIGGSAAWNVENASDQEKPVGQWNRLDLYVVGNRAIHVVNGVPVMVLSDLCDKPAEGVACKPMTHGHIQLQSEGAETYFRNIRLEPITHLPTVTAP